jgi:hypothetical protein
MFVRLPLIRIQRALTDDPREAVEDLGPHHSRTDGQAASPDVSRNLLPSDVGSGGTAAVPGVQGQTGVQHSFFTENYRKALDQMQRMGVSA